MFFGLFICYVLFFLLFVRFVFSYCLLVETWKHQSDGEFFTDWKLKNWLALKQRRIVDNSKQTKCTDQTNRNKKVENSVTWEIVQYDGWMINIFDKL